MSSRTCLFLLFPLTILVLGGCGGQDTGGPAAGLLMHSKAFVDSPVAWDEAPANPVVPAEINGAFPCVLQQGNQLLMWTDNEWGGIYLRTSSDGFTWSQPVACTGLTNGARHARVIYNLDRSRYEIWYWWDSANDYSLNAWGHAVSSDGIAWNQDAKCKSASGHRLAYIDYNKPVPVIGSQGPGQVFYNGGSATVLNYTDLWQNPYVMYYHMRRDRDSKNGIGVAVSLDGITWGVPTEGQMVLEPGTGTAWDSKSATMGAIYRQNGLLHMYYAGGKNYMFGGDGIGYASSLDGLTWVKAAAPIMTTKDGVQWRSYYIGPPSALLVNGERTLFIYVWNGNNRLIGMAKPDLTPPSVTFGTPGETVLWPPTGEDVPVAVSGTAADAKSGLASVTLTVTDEYGTANQELDLLSALDSSGAFNTVVNLTASRNEGDADGRQYTLTLSAVDNKGNAAAPLIATVICPHNKLQDGGGDGPGNGTGNGNGYGIGNGNGNGNGNGHTK